MKKIGFLPLLLAAFNLQAQQTSGTVTYLQTLQLSIDAAALPEGFGAMLPSKHEVEKVLYFNPEATLYENKPLSKEEKSKEYRQEDVSIRIDRQLPEEQVYTDLKNKKVTEQKDLMGRMFLIARDAEAPRWKTTGRQKKILDLPCMEASTGDSITAWYTTAIPVNAGPETFRGLPGLILELNAGSRLQFLATSLSPATPAAQQRIKPPVKGKRVTDKEFEKLAAEKAEALRKQFGGNGNVIIRKQTVR